MNILRPEGFYFKKAMDPFNIIIRVDNHQTDLNIHPQEAETYKVIYHGALIGEIYRSGNGQNWESMTAEELQPGGFPVYEFDENSGHEDLLMNEEVVEKIGAEITKMENGTK